MPRNNQETNLLFLTLLHTIQEKFTNHAILKGGMVLKLLGSSRETLDMDYTFVPFKSKKEIIEDIKKACSSIEGATIKASINSKAIRIIVTTPNAQVQVEVNVSEKCKSIPMSTRTLASNFGIAPRVIKVVSFDVALANKLAAWFERRLIRDLYDIYFIIATAGDEIDMAILKKRLSKIESNIPKLKKIKSVSLENFWTELEDAVKTLDEKAIKKELSAVLDKNEIAGLDMMIRKTVSELVRKNRK